MTIIKKWNQLCIKVSKKIKKELVEFIKGMFNTNDENLKNLVILNYNNV